MPSADVFNTYPPQKQQEIVQRFMELFKGNERGYGFGERKGAFFNPEKNKGEYAPGSIGWKWGKPSHLDFHNHLAGIRALGIGPLLDDGTTNRGEIDVDHIGQDKYNFDYPEEMGKITRSKIPLVVCRTKSTGFRVTCNLSERIEADLVRQGMVNISAILGYSGNEIFPKQSKLAKDDDAPSWTFLPYGPEFGIFAEQCAMNELGNAMELESFLSFAENRRLSRNEFMHHAFDNYKMNTDESGHRNRGNKKNNGVWIEQENERETIEWTFKGGPPCMLYIARQRCTQFQHNFLFAVGTFLKRKYPDNWPTALLWINVQVLRPVGDKEKLDAIIKDLKGRDYEYRCKDEPIHSHCIADACRRMPYGVGTGKTGADHYELGLTIVDRKPQYYYVNMGDTRVSVSPEEIVNLRVYRVKCLGYSGHLPELMKQSEWDQVIKRNIENATIVEPPEILKSNANEIEILEMYLSLHIPNMVRSAGEEYMSGKVGDNVRVKEKEQQIYFKWQGIGGWCRRALGMREKELDKLKLFIIERGQEYGKHDLRDWFRCTLALPFSLFDEAKIHKWLHPDEKFDGKDE